MLDKIKHFFNRSISKSTKMISSSQIKDLSDGNSYCQLCSTQIKNKMLTAHINGKKHRDALKLIRASKENVQKSNNLKKRKADEDENEQFKKAKIINFDTKANNVRNDYNQATSPTSTSQSVNDETKHSSKTANLLELPQGFFDDERMESGVKETLAKQKQMTSELDKFYTEVKELETKNEEQHYEMIENSAITNDILQIDEQIEMWKSINELEKQKEMIIESVAMTSVQLSNSDMNEDSDDNIDDVDFNVLDWRMKTI